MRGSARTDGRFVMEPHGTDPMFALLVRPYGSPPYEVPFDGTSISVGRASTNDVCIADERSASRSHLVLERLGDSVRVRDAGSKNGTWVNGRWITESAQVFPGDRIVIGRTEIELFRTGADAPDDALPPRTRSVAASDVLDTVYGLAADPEATALGGQAVRLLRMVADELLSHRPLERILDSVVGIAKEMTSASRVAIQLLEGEPPRRVTRASRGMSASESEHFHVSRAIARLVIDRRETVLTTDVLADERFSGSDSLIGASVRSVLCAPLWNEQAVIGLIYADTVAVASPFGTDELEILTLLANLAAIRIENLRLLEREQAMRALEHELGAAAEIQRRLLPGAPPPVDGFEFAGLNRPCHAVGGDYFDFVDRGDGRWIVALGDVSGKGMSAALLMASLQASFRAHADRDTPLPDVLTRVNEALVRDSAGDKFVTFFLGELDAETGALGFTNAGHNPPLLVRRAGEIEMLECPGIVLGAIDGAAYEQRQVDLSPGDLLVLYSDGVTEATDAEGELFGESRLRDVLTAAREDSAETIVRRVDDAVRGFTGTADQADDLTLALVKRVTD